MDKALAHISEDGTRTQTVYEHLSGTARLAGAFAAPFGAAQERPNTPHGCTTLANTAQLSSSGWRAVLQPTTRPPVRRKR